MIYERSSPDGRRLVISWVAQYGAWRVKFVDEAGVFSAPRLHDALDQAAGDAAPEGWAQAIANEIEEATDAPQASRPR